MFLRTKLAFTGLSLGLLTVSGAVAQAQQPQSSTQNQTPGTEAARPFGRREGRGFVAAQARAVTTDHGC